MMAAISTCPVSFIAGPTHSFPTSSGIAIPWDVMGDERQRVVVCPECASHIDGVDNDDIGLH